MAVSMKGKHLTSILDFSVEEIYEILKVAETLKLERLRGIPHPVLPGRNLAMIFEKPSTRTRVSFEVGINQLGGSGLYLSSKDLQLGRGETVADTARVLSRYVDGIMARVFSHKTIVELAENSSVSVINGLSDFVHPCQTLADIFTMQEKFGSLKGLKMAYIGDGNNVCNSLMFICAKLGINFYSASPGGFLPKQDVIDLSQKMAKETGCRIVNGTNLNEAVSDAHVIYTDVWVSMGDDSGKEEGIKKFLPYQVRQKLIEKANKDVIVMHCLPAHRGEEITDEVLDGPHSVVWDEAENRLHVQKAIMSLLIR
ncbi:MAG: ornithine carbamoyltransferase [Candidatus Eremiobacteraeota bacterium]|nr:ornithine carbamoyltransferase [Candidatus Eremiobacteraeota bacterium]